MDRGEKTLGAGRMHVYKVAEAGVCRSRDGERKNRFVYRHESDVTKDLS